MYINNYHLTNYKFEKLPITQMHKFDKLSIHSFQLALYWSTPLFINVLRNNIIWYDVKTEEVEETVTFEVIIFTSTLA